LTSIVCVLATVMTSIFGFLLMRDIWVLVAGAVALGFFINAGIAGFYSGMAAGFPAQLRATGSGFALGIGRIGAIVGPFVGAQLLDHHFKIGGLGELGSAYLVVGLPMLVSALAMQFLRLENEK